MSKKSEDDKKVKLQNRWMWKQSIRLAREFEMTAARVYNEGFIKYLKDKDD